MEPEYFVLAVYDRSLCRKQITKLEESIQIIFLFVSLSCVDTFLLILLSSWEISAKPQNSSQ